MLRNYKFFSSLPLEINYTNNISKWDCIAFQMAKQFYKNNNPYDITPLMFLHPNTSRISEELNVKEILKNEKTNFDQFLLISKISLLSGESEFLLKIIDDKLKNYISTSGEQILNLHYLKNSSLFVLSKYYRPKELSLTNNPLLNCQYLLSLIKLESQKESINNLYYKQKINNFNDEVEKISDPAAKILFESHVLKYKINFDKFSIEKEISLILNRFSKIYKANNYYSFLILEAKRRLQEYLFHHFFSQGFFEKAYLLACEILSYDPYCPRAHFLKGKVLMKLGKSKEARNDFLTALSISSQDKDKIAEIISLDSLDFFFVNKKIQKTTILNRLCSFFDSTNYEPNTTISYGPWAQWYSIKNNRDPYFQTMTTQRAMPVRFRKELYYALNFIDPKIHELKQTLDYGIFIERAPKEISDFLNLKNSDKKTKALQSRLLSSLGFYQEAYKNIQQISSAFKSNPTIEGAYLLSTCFFIEQIIFPQKIKDIYQIYNEFYSYIPESEQTLRIRLTMQMSFCVICGQNNLIASLEVHHVIMKNLLENLWKSENFSLFEKNLLSSRAYRASSYYPFLIKDSAQLLYEINECQRFAFAINPTDKIEEILKHENFFPMYESSGRAYEFLKDFQKSFNFMRKITVEIDGNDSKAWLQVAEGYEKIGDLNSALECYKKAVSLSCPLAKIAYYKLGRTYEKLNMNQEALYAYLSSLYHWPIGISPLKRISEISLSLGLSIVHDIAQVNLKEIENDFL